MTIDTTRNETRDRPAREPSKPSRLLGNPSVRILVGLVVGLGAGAVLAGTESAAIIGGVLRPFGKLWLDALTMTVVPLISALIISGIIQAARSGSDKVAARALFWFACLQIGACLFAALFVPALLGLTPVPEAAGVLRDSQAALEIPRGDLLASIIPTNPVKAAANGEMVPIVVFALLFGLAASRTEPTARDRIEGFFNAVVQTMLVLVGWVLLLAPLGVLALAFGVGATMGVGAAGVLLHYVMVVVVTLIAVLVLTYVAVTLFGHLGPIAFGRAALPAQIIALTTQSSLASMPAMIAAAGPLAVGKAEAGIVLPIAVAVFRAASAAGNVAVAIYLAGVYGIELTPTTLLVGALVAAGVGIGAVGLPAQVSFFAVVGPVCIAMGVPVVLLPLLLAIETVPDMFRTVGNVTADLAVTRIACRETAADRASSGEALANT